MSDVTAESENELESGTYELLRQRLEKNALDLVAGLQQLNQKRTELFGSSALKVIGRTRIRTENNCIPRDIKAIGQQLLFGYNVYVGLRSEMQVQDVFNLYDYKETDAGIELQAADAGFLADSRFVEDFKTLYRYYNTAKLSQLRRVKDKGLAIFQTGESLTDFKIYRWQINDQEQATYIDNRGERDNILPDSHAFSWVQTSRDDHVNGTHPHVNILNTLFVETTGGDLTIKIENNTEGGQGIYNEPVEDANQSLADAQISYAQLGKLIILKIRPYRESDWRYLIYNPLTEQVSRIDAIGKACAALPEGHGLIYPSGYYLESGENKEFDQETDMHYQHHIRSPNGEDVLYIFYHPQQGKYVLYSYNLIRREVHPPINCHGYSLLGTGQMIIFRADEDTPSKTHPMQIWQTPYTSVDQVPVADSHNHLSHIGNAELVRGISAAYNLKHLLDQATPTATMYEQLILHCKQILDNHHWLSHQDSGQLSVPIQAMLDNAEHIIDEFDKVQKQKRHAQAQLQAVESVQKNLIEQGKRQMDWQSINDYVQHLAALQQQRGQLLALKSLRYIDLAAIEQLEQQASAEFEDFSEQSIHYLLEQDGLSPYQDQIEAQLQQIDDLNDSLAVAAQRQQLQNSVDELDLLSDILNNLQTQDSNARAQMLEGIADTYALLNRCRAELDNKAKQLKTQEAQAEFSAQYKLFNQTVSSALAQVNTPEQADDQLAKLLLQLEDLEARFSEFDDYLLQITDKREEVQNSLESRKQSLLEQRGRRALHLLQAAERILDGIQRKAASLSDAQALNTYFATDNRILKIHELAQKLMDLGDNVKAGDIKSRLKTLQEQAGRTLRDQQEIYSDGGKTIQLGKYRFSVTQQNLELSLLPHEQDGQTQLSLHLSGTDFFSPVDNPILNQSKAYWEQSLSSETNTIYRAEYLAAELLPRANLNQAADEQLKWIQAEMAQRYDQGYERGIHDHDTQIILNALLKLQQSTGLLRYPPACRSLALLFWQHHTDREQCQRWESTAKNLQQLQSSFNQAQTDWQQWQQQIQLAIQHFIETHALDAVFPLLPSQQPKPAAGYAAEYLLNELQNGGNEFVATIQADMLTQACIQHLDNHGQKNPLEQTLKQLDGQLSQQYALIDAWLLAYRRQESRIEKADYYHVEAVAMLMGVLLV